MATLSPTPPTFFERARKAVVAGGSLLVLFVGALATADLTTWQGVLGAVVVVAGTYATWKAQNKYAPADVVDLS